MSRLFYYVFRNLSLGLLALSVFYGLYNFKRIPRPLKIFVVYLSSIFLIELLSVFLAGLNLTNTFLFYIYTYIEVTFLGYIFYSIKFLNRRQIYVLIISALAILLVNSYDLFVFLKDGIQNSHGKVMSNMFIISLAGFYLVHQIKQSDQKIEKSFARINPYLLIYYSSSLTIFIILKQLQDIPLSYVHIVWGINNLLTAFLYAVSFFAIRKAL